MTIVWWQIANGRPGINGHKTCRNEEFSRLLIPHSMSLIHNVCFKSNPVHSQRCSLAQDAVPGKRKVKLSGYRGTVPFANTESKLGQRSHELDLIQYPHKCTSPCKIDLLLVMNAQGCKYPTTCFPGVSPPLSTYPTPIAAHPSAGLWNRPALFSTSTSS